MEIESKKQNEKSEDNGKVRACASATEDVSSARRVLVALAAALVAIVAYLLATPPKGPLPKWNRPVCGYAILTLFWVVAAGLPALALIRAALRKTRRKMMRGVKRLVLCAISVAVCIVAFDVICARYPVLQTSFVSLDVLWNTSITDCIEDSKYGFKGRPNITITYTFDPVQGGLTALLPPSRIVDTGEKKVINTIRHDKNGFCNPDVPAHADFVITGDSFAEDLLMDSGKRWVTYIRDNVKGGTYNIAIHGWGPQCEAMAVEEYGLSLKPKVAIWSFYEGNDLLDAEDFQEFEERFRARNMTWTDYLTVKLGLPPQAFPYNRPFARLLLHVAELLNPPEREIIIEDAGNTNPIHLTAGGKTHWDAVQYTDFAHLLKQKDSFARWNGWEITQRCIRHTIEQCRHNNTQFVLVYFPSKTRVYLPLINEQVDHESFYRLVEPCLQEIWRRGSAYFFKELNSNESNMEQMVKKLCVDNGAVFISTTDALKDAANSGDFPYWSYDTHLNLDGNKIAANTILENLRKLNLLQSSESDNGSGE